MNTRCIRLALAAAACVAGIAQAQSVAPPPLPIGSLQARPEPGMSEPERKRAVRAHHHKFHHKKDFTRDDSVHGHESLAAHATHPVGARPAAAGAGAATPGAPAAAGGAGTGPARKPAGKAASSYFHGNPKK